MNKKRSVYNILTGTISQLLLVGLGFISRRLFITHLGNEINGLNSYLGTVVSLLSLFEFGLGSVLLLQLYEPVKKNDQSKIVSLLQFFSNLYKKIAIFTVVVALLCGFFLPKMVNINGTGISMFQLYIIFGLFILSMVINYFFTVERIFVQANQQMYILTTFDSIYSLSRYIAQIIILIVTQNYMLYLVLDIILHVIESLILRRIIRKKYPFLMMQSYSRVSADDQRKIKSSTKSLGMHKVSSFLINNSDNFFLSSNLFLLGNLTNYNLIISTISLILSQFANSLTAGFGSMLITDDKKHHYNSYRLVGFVNFLLTNFGANCLWILITPFIGSVWLSNDYILNQSVVFILILNFILSNLSIVTNTIRSAAGDYKHDRGTQFVIAGIKISLSWIGIHFFGLTGLLLATTVALFLRESLVIPKIVYRNILNVPYRLYCKEYGVYLFVILANMFLLSGINKILALMVVSIYIQFIVMLLISLFLPSIIVIIIFHRTQKMSSVKYLLWKALRKGKLMVSNHIN